LGLFLLNLNANNLHLKGENMKRLVIIFFIIFIFLVSCKKESNEKNITIVTTLFPLYDFAKEVGKDRVNVVLILPPGAEPHSYEPSPKDIVKINEAKIFIYIGESLEKWADNILNSISNKDLIVIEAEKYVEEYLDEGEKENHEENEEYEEKDHNHSGKDPHIWLDFEIDKNIVNKIAESLAKVDPQNRDFYFENAKIYNERLNQLDKEYKNTIEKCQIKTIMYAGHFAFGYLARRYNLIHISPYSGFSSESEPTPQKIMEMIDNIKKNNIDYIFYEELIDPKLAKIISKEANVKMELLNAAHNITKKDLEKNISFIEIMTSNLEKLKKGLKYNGTD